jgi:hypothetical protein
VQDWKFWEARFELREVPRRIGLPPRFIRWTINRVSLTVTTITLVFKGGRGPGLVLPNMLERAPPVREHRLRPASYSLRVRGGHPPHRRRGGQNILQVFIWLYRHQRGMAKADKCRPPQTCAYSRQVFATLPCFPQPSFGRRISSLVPQLPY